MNYKKLWIGLSSVIIGSLAVLLYFGWQLYQVAPPVPKRVVTTSGKVVFTGEQIKDGQNVWQSMGGQEVGSVWGHGAYVAPDWSADWLHRELVWILDKWAQQELEKPYAELDEPAQASLRARLKKEIRANTYNPETGDIVISDLRAEAISHVKQHYASLFGNNPELNQLRDAYAIPPNSVPDPERREAMNAFFFWASWACATDRPNSEVTYTHNWPGEYLIENTPTGQLIVWSVLSFVLLLAGVGALAWYYAVQRHKEEHVDRIPHEDPLRMLQPTPSMRATLKYFWTVAALVVVQIGLGAVAAHYGVEGNGFYGIPLSEWLPYSVVRTWHTQLGIFWIATAWLATGLFVAPAVSNYEPKFQRFGVNFLFVCLLVIVVGSMAGQWFGAHQKLGHEMNFWFGHQGLEYVDLGRFWQLFLFVGLFVWLFLMARALWPVFRRPGENRHLLALFLVASAAIAMFYGAGLMWGRQSNLAIIEYWRWWVVHLWVEGFFEVFATVVIAFLFVRLGLLKAGSATRAVLFSTIIFLGGGMIGTFHHLYFSGTPTAVLALGATFSALEVVPLVLIGFEAYENLTMSRITKWIEAYKWPIYFFVAVAFWNLVGAGLFGFFINPPIALYYMQGLNTTPVHGHTALFGVYGMLGIGLMLFCLRGLTPAKVWKNGAISFTFWSLNIGLALMVLLSLLPVGLMQAWASVERGMWYARSAEFMQTPLMDTLRWLRVIGDTIFALGATTLGWFVLGLKTGWSLKEERADLTVPTEKFGIIRTAEIIWRSAAGFAEPAGSPKGKSGGEHAAVQTLRDKSSPRNSAKRLECVQFTAASISAILRIIGKLLLISLITKHVRHRVIVPSEEYKLVNFRQDDMPGVAAINSALRDFEPKIVFAWHLSIMLNFENLIENGMPSQAERDVVDEFGDMLDAQFKGEDKEKPNALFLARITWNGTRELIYRVYEPKLADSILREIIEAKSYPREFDYRMENDPDWKLAEWHLNAGDGS